MRPILLALLCVVATAAGLCFFVSPAGAIVPGGDYTVSARYSCLGDYSPEDTIKACLATRNERVPSEVKPKIFLALARAYGALHHTQSALHAYDTVAALEPTNYEALAAGCWIRGLLNIELDRALGQCQQALALDPGDAQIVEDRCLVYFRMSNYAKAEADCSGAASFRSTAPQALFIRGLAKLKNGDSVGGNADMSAAKKLKADIANDFAADNLAP